MARSSTLARLTVETAASHASIDEALLGPLEFPTATAYRRFLCTLYGFQAPLEAALILTPQIDLDFVQERCKAGRMASDLLSLGLSRREFHLLARRQVIPSFGTPAQALGWLYATERLMLQVEALRVRLTDEMPVVFTLANHFITTYSNTAELRWRQYGVMLDRVARVYGADAIVAAARDGIACLQSWLVECGAPVKVATPDARATA